MMINRLFLVLAAALFLCGPAARAATPDNANWKLEATSPAKAIDFLVHNSAGGDNKVYAITHDDKIYRRDGVDTWVLAFDIQNNATSKGVAEIAGQSTRMLLAVADPTNALNRKALWPQMVSFKGSLYVVRPYRLKIPSNGVCTGYEWVVLKIDGGTATQVLQNRGPCLNYNPEKSWQAMTNGYLFTPDGATLYFGGGGGKNVSPVEADFQRAAPGYSWDGWDPRPSTWYDFRYVYKTTDAAGAVWSLVNYGPTDEWGRKVGRAIPNGYRYNHIIPFNGNMWDYYGYYEPDLTFHSKLSDGAKDVYTEPWGHFLMGVEKNTDGTDAWLYRVGFNPRGDQTAIYRTNGGNWTQFYKKYAVPPATGEQVYWRAIASITQNGPDAVLPIVKDDGNPKHNGLYCLYSSYDTALSTYESGVYRYFADDGSSAGPPIVPANRVAGWVKVISTNQWPSGMPVAGYDPAKSAAVFTGGLFINKLDGIYVGTSQGVVRRGIFKTPTDPDPETP